MQQHKTVLTESLQHENFMCGGAEEIFYLAGLTQAQIVSEEFKSVHITLTK
jgi:hypothetical protein